MPTRATSHQSQPSRPVINDRRPSAAKRGYDRNWREARAAYLSEHRLCVQCLKEGKLPSFDIWPHGLRERIDGWVAEWLYKPVAERASVVFIFEYVRAGNPGNDTLLEQVRTYLSMQATEVDHKTPHRMNLALFWEQNNWQALCETHHKAKTGRGE